MTNLTPTNFYENPEEEEVRKRLYEEERNAFNALISAYESIAAKAFQINKKTDKVVLEVIKEYNKAIMNYNELKKKFSHTTLKLINLKKKEGNNISQQNQQQNSTENINKYLLNKSGGKTKSKSASKLKTKTAKSLATKK